jgi:hypothetical protein
MKSSSLLSAGVCFLWVTLRSVEVIAQCPTCPKVDWTTLPSTYTHAEGAVVDQFSQGVIPTAHAHEVRQTSVYRHHRSSLQGAFSTDHYHRVDQFGAPVQPYGEWRYPYRPYSVPYQAWGPQLPQVLNNVNGFNRGIGLPWNGGPMNPGIGFGGFGVPGNGDLIPGPMNALPAQQDEFYPSAPEPPQMTDRQFFYSPIRP